MQNITFLDASTLGEIDLQGLTEFGRFTAHPVSSPSETSKRLSDTTIAITNKVVIDEAIMRSAPNLKLVCIAATGTNCVDLKAASKLNIPVCNVAGYSTASVTQHAIGFLINLATGMHLYANEANKWANSPIFTRLDHRMTDLAGKTLGIVGLGTIGQSVATAATGLGMNVIALAREGSASGGHIPRINKDEFFAQSDAITLHCPLTPETHQLINHETLKLMKPTAFLINTGRGDLINEQDLSSALQKGTIAGAALDVLTTEPPVEDHLLLNKNLPNLIITPHTAWASNESRQRLLEGIMMNIRGFLKGHLTNQVN